MTVARATAIVVSHKRGLLSHAASVAAIMVMNTLADELLCEIRTLLDRQRLEDDRESSSLTHDAMLRLRICFLKSLLDWSGKVVAQVRQTRRWENTSTKNVSLGSTRESNEIKLKQFGRHVNRSVKMGDSTLPSQGYLDRGLARQAKF